MIQAFGTDIVRTMNPLLQVVAQRGEQIYRERYKAEYEKSYAGMYGVIDVDSERIFLSDTPETALEAGLNALPEARFYLVKIGAAGVYKVAYSRSDRNRGNRAIRGV